MEKVPTYGDILKQLSALTPEQLNQPALAWTVDTYGEETVCPVELAPHRFRGPGEDEQYLLFDKERSQYRIAYTSDIPDPSTYEGRLHAKHIVEVKTFGKDDVIFVFDGMDDDADEELASMTQVL